MKVYDFCHVNRGSFADDGNHFGVVSLILYSTIE